MEQDEKQRPLADVKYIKTTLDKYPNLKPVSTALFGGKYNILGLFKGSNNDLSKVEAWADDLASKLEEGSLKQL